MDSRPIDSPQSPQLLKLSEELMREVFRYFCDHCVTSDCMQTHSQNTQSLVNLCLTCKPIQKIAEEILYHNFTYKEKLLCNRLRRFAGSLTINPHLAAFVRRVILWKEESDKTAGLPDALECDKSQKEMIQNEYIMHLCHTREILSKVDKIRELRVDVRNCDISVVEFHRLQTLCLFWASSIRWQILRPQPDTSKIVTAFLKAAPNLHRLELVKWAGNPRTVEDLCAHQLGIKEIYIEPDTLDEIFEEDCIAILLEKLGYLDTFEFVDHMGGDQLLLEHLHPGQRKLKAVSIDTLRYDFYLSDIFQLSSFTKLTSLKLHGYFIDIYGVGERSMASSSLPPNLVNLDLCNRHVRVDALARLVVHLSQTIFNYTKLKRVRCGQDREAGNFEHLKSICSYEDVERSFTNYGVHFELYQDFTRYKGFRKDKQ